MSTSTKTLALLIVFFAGLSATTFAQNAAIIVDENGKGSFYGTPLASGLKLDPLSGMTTLAYQLPFPGVPGDVQLIEPNAPIPSAPSDVIRFDGKFTMYFFSDLHADDGPPFDLADVGLPPSVPGLLTVALIETGPEGNNGAYYNAGFFNPGGNTAAADYYFISDMPTPEPASLGMLCLGGVLALTRRGRSARLQG
jgi:hypothetical protein